MQFHPLLPFMFSWTMNKSISVLFSLVNIDKVTFYSIRTYEQFSYTLTFIKLSVPNELSYRKVFRLPHFLHRLKRILFQYWLKPVKVVRRSWNIEDLRHIFINFNFENDFSQLAIENPMVSSNLYAIHTAGKTSFSDCTTHSRACLGLERTAFVVKTVHWTLLNNMSLPHSRPPLANVSRTPI